MADVGVTDTESIMRPGVASFPIGVRVDESSVSRANSFLIVSSVIYLLRRLEDFASVVI